MYQKWDDGYGIMINFYLYKNNNNNKYNWTFLMLQILLKAIYIKLFYIKIMMRLVLLIIKYIFKWFCMKKL